MTATVLVAGSTAFDQTGIYGGDFAEYQSNYPINALNMSFQLKDLKTSYGGCAANIAWGLAQIDINALPVSSAGRNFQDHFVNHLQSGGVDTRYIAVDEETEHTATCLMINDLAGNQIISFYPGPHAEDRKMPREIPDITSVDLAILGPEAPDLTLVQARDLATLGIPTIFDPGQVISDYQRDDIMEILSLTDYLIVNDYEFEVMQANAELGATDITSWISETVVTHGAKGVDVYTRDDCIHVDAIPGVDVVDVTGCGDAFRAGYAFGIVEGFGQQQCAEFGCVMAAINLVTPHTQTYRTSPGEIRVIHEKHYGTGQ